MEHKVNKGADRGVEFSGLQAQYLYVLAGGLLSVFLVFVILYMAGVNRWFCILFGAVSASTLVLAVFRLGRKYGPPRPDETGRGKVPPLPYYQS